jgi:hypothetical protein
MHVISRSRATRGLATALTAALLAGCAGHAVRPERALSVDWRAVACDACDRAGLRVDVRRSAGDGGRAGRWLYARVVNLNAHPVSAVVELVLRGSAAQPDFVPYEQLGVTLRPAGHEGSESVVMLRGADVRGVVEAVLHGAEGY